ncbi:MAG: hypothetical protein ACLUUO_19340 [Sellimonas intestinalis]
MLVYWQRRCVVTAALGGCSGSGKGSGGDASSSDGSGGTFIVRSAGDPMSFNPDVAGDDNGYPIAQNMFRRLCALDSSKQNLVPEAASPGSIMRMRQN